ncbi:hypothetical protein V6Z11_D04G196200 [Gossypium hirsutum]
MMACDDHVYITSGLLVMQNQIYFFKIFSVVEYFSVEENFLTVAEYFLLRKILYYFWKLILLFYHFVPFENNINSRLFYIEKQEKFSSLFSLMFLLSKNFGVLLNYISAIFYLGN